MPSTPSRRHLLTLTGAAGLGALGGYGVAVRDVPRKNPLLDADCDPAPLAASPTEWPYPNYDAGATGHAPKESAPTELTLQWNGPWTDDPDIRIEDVGRVVVGNGLAFVTEVHDWGPNVARWLRAFDVRDGTERWRRWLDTDSPTTSPANVTALGNSVFCEVSVGEPEETGTAHALAAADGTVRWRAQGPNRSYPTIHGGLAYVHEREYSADRERTTVHLRDAASGEPCTTFRVAGLMEVTPFGDSYAVVHNHSRLAGLDLDSHELVWRTDPDGGPRSLAVADDRIHVELWRGKFATFDLPTGDRLWAVGDEWETGDDADPSTHVQEELGAVTPSVVALRQRVYDEGASDRLRARDPATGRLLWDRPAGDDDRVWAVSRPVVAGDEGFVAEHVQTRDDDTARLLRFDVATGDVLETTALSGEPRGHPTVADGRLFLPTDRGLRAFGR